MPIIHLPTTLVSIQWITHIMSQFINRKQHNLNQNKRETNKIDRISVFNMCLFQFQLTVTQAPNVVEKTCVHVKNAMLNVIATRQLIWYGSCKNGLSSLLLHTIYFIYYYCHFQVDIKCGTLFCMIADIDVAA